MCVKVLSLLLETLAAKDIRRVAAADSLRMDMGTPQLVCLGHGSKRDWTYAELNFGESLRSPTVELSRKTTPGGCR